MLNCVRASSPPAALPEVEYLEWPFEEVNGEWARIPGDAYVCRRDLTGANLAGANLREADLAEANLEGANFTDAVLGIADLNGANLTGASLRGTDLADAELIWANLGGANLWGAKLDKANLRGADLVEVKGLTQGMLNCVRPTPPAALPESLQWPFEEVGGKWERRYGDAYACLEDF